MPNRPYNRLAGTLLWLGIAFAAPALATEDPGATGTAAKPIPEAQSFVTVHSGKFNGESLRYTATAAETYIRDKEGEPKASIFSFAYTKKADDEETRPVTFVWNGGPGSASLWLHMGAYGPKRISVPSDAAHPGSPPFDILDAPETILDVTDLVFVDPVGTGFSRALGEHEGKEFWGLTADARSLTEFIQTWTTENGRWNSPRFLLGESFGTTRAALIARLLQGDDFQMGVNGLIFISQALDYTGSSPNVRDNLIASAIYLPTMAATALYHGKINPPPEDRDTFLAEARHFATDELLPALFKGHTLDAETRERVRDGLAYYTGLSPAYIERSNLRINGHRFAKELLRDQGLTVGLLDSRYTTDEIDDLAADPAVDAGGDAISPAFKSALMDYISRDLEVAWDRSYLAPADKDLYPQWNWRPIPEDTHWNPMPVNTAHDLSAALRMNPGLRVFVASGYYDLITPFFDAEYTLNRHDIRPGRISYKYYSGGHMMYVHEPSRTQLLEDTRAFIRAQLGE